MQNMITVEKPVTTQAVRPTDRSPARAVIAAKILSVTLDFSVVWLAYSFGSVQRLGAGPGLLYCWERLEGFLAASLVTLLVFYMHDVYPRFRTYASFNGLNHLGNALVYVFLLQGFAIYWGGVGEAIGRGIFSIALFAQTVLFCLTKAAVAICWKRLGFRDRALLVGYNPEKEFYFRFLAEHREKLPVEIIGIVCDGDGSGKIHDLPFPVLGSYEELESLSTTHRVRNLILTSTYPERGGLQEFLIMAHQNHSRLINVDGLYEEVMKKIPYETISRAEILNECLLAHKFAQLKKKRVLDLCLGGLVTLLFLPVGLLVALGIKLSSRGRVFFVQERLGLRGKTFKLMKFRTMRMDAEKETGATLSQKNDPRVTRYGRFLRKTHLDEFPQLINVLRGEMSLVGPRPERAEFIRKLEKRIPLYALRLFTKPGITGWAQVTHGYASTIEDLEEKFRYDLYYLKHMSIRFDLQALLSTIKHFLLAQGH